MFLVFNHMMIIELLIKLDDNCKFINQERD